LVIDTVRRDAQNAITDKVPAARDFVIYARDTLPLEAHAGACLRTGVSVGNGHACLLLPLAATDHALGTVVVEVGGLNEFNTIAFVVTPGVLAIALELRHERAKGP
jgi:hypothetical protein